MKTVEIFRLDMFGLDAYLVQPEENKKSPELLRQLNIGLCALYMLNVHDIDGVKRVYGLQVAIMEVLGMAGKLLRNISPDKIENRDAEYYKQALDLSPGL